MKNIYFALFIIITTFTLNAQDLAIYNVNLYEVDGKESFAFISLSDNYPLSEHPDSLAIPESKNNLQYFKLEGKYRKQFLYKTKISESDKVFIYDYAANVLVSFPVKLLNTVACLSYYSSPDEAPFSQDYYMIGFEIDKKLLKGFDTYFNNILVCIGKKSPFVEGGLKPMSWEKIKPEDFPFIAITPENEALLRGYLNREYKGGNAWKYENEGFQYFILDMLDNKNKIFARRVIVLKSKTNEFVCERIYSRSEGTSLSPLNFTNPDYTSPEQFAGKLFHDKPPVMLGFEQVSFGCPEITILDPNEKYLYINCDNRH